MNDQLYSESADSRNYLSKTIENLDVKKIMSASEGELEKVDIESQHSKRKSETVSMLPVKRKLARPFDLRASTEEHHKILHTNEGNLEEDHTLFYGAYGHLRKKLDYKYHSYYRKERQWLHDSIIENCLEHLDEELHEVTVDFDSLSMQDHVNGHGIPPWFILAVGVQGSGKHYTIRHLVKKGKLLLLPFVSVDPDDIRRYLPEYSTYLHECPEHVDALTQKECGYIAETLVLAALQSGRNAILHCQLRDSEWYKYYIDHFLRNQFPGLKVALIHFTVDQKVAEERSSKLEKETESRHISSEEISRAIKCIPDSVEIVKSVVDYYGIIANNIQHEPVLENDTWAHFKETFDQRSLVAPDTAATVIPDDASSTTPSALAREETLQPDDVPQRRSSCRRMSFSWINSSEENHRVDDMKFYGQFAHIREQLDYSYHSNYNKSRQSFQDSIIREFLNAAVIKDKNGEVCTTPTEPWIVFTAGAMGAGKSYTMRKLVEEGRFPLLAFVRVDPDAIRRYLPEFHVYLKENPELAGDLTRKEAGYIAEVLTLAGLQAGKNVMVDGSLRDAKWYKEYFGYLRKRFCNLRLAIIHVTAPRDAVIERASNRALQTGRIVPRHVLEESLEQVPKSVEKLTPLVDYHAEVRNAPNAPDIELVTAGETWDSFTMKWVQTCAWIPTSKKKILEKSKEMESKLVAGLEH